MNSKTFCYCAPLPGYKSNWIYFFILLYLKVTDNITWPKRSTIAAFLIVKTEEQEKSF